MGRGQTTKERPSAVGLHRLLDVCSELDVENVMEVDSQVAFQDGGELANVWWGEWSLDASGRQRWG